MFIYIETHTYIHTYIHSYTHTYIHTGRQNYVQTYTHIHTLTRRKPEAPRTSSSVSLGTGLPNAPLEALPCVARAALKVSRYSNIPE